MAVQEPARPCLDTEIFEGGVTFREGKIAIKNSYRKHRTGDVSLSPWSAGIT